ncbi:hypothetical protein DIPPA_70206 [Diplonema papillatum]|nr:hypothetical protein DIPPA_70206 [Diplonema papillatum]
METASTSGKRKRDSASDELLDDLSHAPPDVTSSGSTQFRSACVEVGYLSLPHDYETETDENQSDIERPHQQLERRALTFSIYADLAELEQSTGTDSPLKSLLGHMCKTPYALSDEILAAISLHQIKALKYDEITRLASDPDLTLFQNAVVTLNHVECLEFTFECEARRTKPKQPYKSVLQYVVGARFDWRKCSPSSVALGLSSKNDEAKAWLRRCLRGKLRSKDALTVLDFFVPVRTYPLILYWSASEPRARSNPVISSKRVYPPPFSAHSQHEVFPNLLAMTRLLTSDAVSLPRDWLLVFLACLFGQAENLKRGTWDHTTPRISCAYISEMSKWTLERP